MTFRNPLGSISALSLAANPAELIPAAVVAGAAITVGATVATYKAYKDYEEKKQRAAIEKINQLHEIHLAKIRIPDFNEIQGFPPLFKLAPGKDSSAVESMHMTEDQVRQIGTVLPSGSDIALATYREAVSDAIAKLKAYYFSRKDKNDITAGVICYLLYMLETKCLNFAGYTYDIAYLNAISNFITAYASSEGRENSQHFSRLGPVYQDLVTAKQLLEEHKIKLSLEDMLSELKDACNYKSKQLIRLMAKVIVKDKYWELIETVTMGELKDGILRREYIKSEVKGVVFKKDDEIKVDDSIFRTWLTSLANFYVQTLDPDSKIISKEIKSPAKLFAVPNYARLTELTTRRKLTKDEKEKLTDEQKETLKREKEELKQLEEDFKKTSEAFLEHKNFLTTKLDPKTKNKDARMIPVTDQNEIAQRLQVFANFATLLHQIISLQHLCTHILKSTKQLGELYVKSPHHFVRVFTVLDELCNLIKDNVTKSKKDLTAIQKTDLNTLQLEQHEVLPNQINELLDAAFGSISTLGSRIKDYRYRVANKLNPNEATFHSVKLEMFEVTGLLAKIYSISTDTAKKEETLMRSESSEQKTEKSKHRHSHKRKEDHSESQAESSSHTKTADAGVKQSKSLFKLKRLHIQRDKKHSMPDIEISAPITSRPMVPAAPDVNPTHTTNSARHSLTTLPTATENSVAVKDEPVAVAANSTNTTSVSEVKTQQLPVDHTDHDLHADSADEEAIEKEAEMNVNYALENSNEDKINQITTDLLNLLAVNPDIKNENNDEINLHKIYRELTDHINTMKQKTLALLNEPNKDAERQKKADQSYALYMSIIAKLKTFAQHTPADRQQNAATLKQTIHDELTDPNNNFIDTHFRPASRALYSMTKFGIFQTDSRKKYTQLSFTIDKLADHYLQAEPLLAKSPSLKASQ